MALQVNDWIWLRLSSRYGVTAAEAQLGDVFKRWLDETAQTWGYSLVDFYASKNVAGTTFGDGAYNYWSGGALQDAAFWIDAFSASGTSVTNLGSGGSALNARYGSTTGVDSADPVLLTHTGTNYLHLPAVANNYVSAPHNAAYRPTSSVSMRFSVSLDAWKPITLSNYLGGHYDGALNQRSYLMAISASSGAPYVNLSVDGTAVAGISASAAPVVNDGDRLAIRADWLAAGPVVRFYTKPVTAAALDDVTSDTGWTQLGTDVTVGVPATLWGATSVMNVAGYPSASGTGSKFYASAVKVDGVLQCATDFTTGITSGSQTTFTESSVNAATVTINRAVSGRKSVAVTRPVWLFGTDDYMEVTQDPYTAYVQTVGTSAAATATYTAYDTGTATAGAATTLDDTTKAWTAGVYISRVVRITGGTGVGQVRVITAQTATQLTVTPAWTTIPDATSTYIIESRGNVNGDIDITVRCALDNWATGVNQLLVSKRSATQYSYQLYMSATGVIGFSYTLDNVTGQVFGSTVAPFSNGVPYWIRLRRTASTGAWTTDYAADQATEPSSWTPIASGTSVAGTIWQGSADVGIGGTPAVSYTAGKFYTAIVRDGFGGNTAAYWQACGHPAGGNYVNANKVLWTKGATATVVNPHPMNFAANSPFTMVTVQRTWATPATSGAIMSKWSGGGGWNMRNGFGTPTQPLFTLNDFNTSQGWAFGTPTLGALTVLAVVVEPTQVTNYTNNAVFGPLSRTVFEGAASETQMRIGSTAAGGSFNDFELLAVAVIPKALTAAEIARIVAAYQ